jgi:hypothetical protein
MINYIIVSPVIVVCFVLLNVGLPFLTKWWYLRLIITLFLLAPTNPLEEYVPKNSNSQASTGNVVSAALTGAHD